MKIIEVKNCLECPYNTGYDPMDAPLGNEYLFCGYDRLTKDPNLRDQPIGYFPPVDTKEVPIPKWCQLKDAQNTFDLKRKIDA